MKQTGKNIIIYIIALAIWLLTLPCDAMDSEEYKQWETTVSIETETLKRNLPSAMKGGEDDIKALIGLAAGEYIRSAEGGEWLNEIYLDLMMAHPVKFLRLVSDADKSVRETLVHELLNPVSDKYSQSDLKNAVETAKAGGLNDPFLQKLLDFYSAP